MLELSLVAKVTMLLAAVLGAVKMARTARAAVRHLLLAATLCVLVILPVVTVAMPPVPVDLPISAFESMERPSANASPRTDPAQPAARHAVTSVRQDGAAPVSIAAILRTTWGLGVVGFFLPLATALIRIRRLRSNGLPWLEGRALVQRLVADAGLRRSVDVLLHEDLSGPMTIGWLRPAVVLPTDARTWTEAECRNALVHELEHVRRADWVFQLVGRVACSLYWFHPLVWVAWREMALEAERACDDAVLQGADGPAYATQLVDLASRHTGGIATPALGMANRSDLAARVSSILTNDHSRGRASRWASATVAAAAVLVALTVSPLRASVPTRPALLGTLLRQMQKPAVAGATPTFEVASIKRHNPDEPGRGFTAAPGGRVALINQTLQELISSSYGVQNYQLIGVTDWMTTEAWDVLAKAEGEPPLPERLGMVRQLLADRFKLVMHVETRELPIYQLVKVRSDGQLGPAVKVATCLTIQAGGVPGKEGTCDRSPINQARGTYRETRNTFRGLATNLGRVGLIGRPVVDHTGLSGEYAYELNWTPEPQPGAAPASDAISLFTALQEQLGLKLEATRGPVEVFVIDSVERATEN